MISRATAWASGMSVPTLSPSQRSAHWAVPVRRGSTANILAPLRMPLRTCWKKIGWALRAAEPH